MGFWGRDRARGHSSDTPLTEYFSSTVANEQRPPPPLLNYSLIYLTMELFNVGHQHTELNKRTLFAYFDAIFPGDGFVG
jgi:hypothetical protein